MHSKMNEKIISRIIKYSQFIRPFLFMLVLLFHILLIFMLNFKNTEESLETVDFREAQVFKLVDIEEYVKPPVNEKTVEVVNQEKASENIIETEKQVLKSEEDYLPQHKISNVPVIPSKEVLSRIVYPPLALKQGIEASVFLELYIDSSGIVKKIKILKDPGHGFAEAAVNALKGLKCIPASANGKNVAVRYRYPVRFSIQ